MTTYKFILTRSLQIHVPLEPIIVYGLPVGLSLLMLFLPDLGAIWVGTVVAIQMLYFLIHPTAERSVWVLCSYIFSVGGSTLFNPAYPALTQVPGWITWLSYIIIPVAVAGQLVRRTRWRTAGIFTPLMALIGLSALSALLHQAGPLNLIGWLAHFLRYPLWFLALVNSDVRPDTARAWLRAYITLSILQIPTAIIQFLILAPDPAKSFDAIVGTMFGSQSGLMAMAVLAGLHGCLGYALAARRPIYRLLPIFLLFIPIMLAGAGFVLIAGVLTVSFLVMTWGVTVRQPRQGRFLITLKRRLMPVIAGGFLLSASAVTLALTLFASSIDELRSWFTGAIPSLTSIRAFIDPVFAATSSRQQFIATTFAWFRLYPEQIFFGSLGPQLGLGVQSSGLLGETAMSRINEAVGLSRLIVQFNVQLPRTILEIGLVGLGLFYWLFGIVWKRSTGSQTGGQEEPWVRGQTFAFCATGFLYLVLGLLYLDIWRLDQVNFAFWLWAAALYHARRAHQAAIS